MIRFECASTCRRVAGRGKNWRWLPLEGWKPGEPDAVEQDPSGRKSLNRHLKIRDSKIRGRQRLQRRNEIQVSISRIGAIMKNYLVPALAILLITIVLVAINELTELTFIQDYALLFIVAAMLFGVWLGKRR